VLAEQLQVVQMAGAVIFWAEAGLNCCCCQLWILKLLAGLVYMQLKLCSDMRLAMLLVQRADSRLCTYRLALFGAAAGAAWRCCCGTTCLCSKATHVACHPAQSTVVEQQSTTQHQRHVLLTTLIDLCQSPTRTIACC
jgi:hypothetical protein